MAFITTGKLAQLKEIDGKRDYVEISRMDSETLLYESYKITVEDLLSGYQQSTSYYANGTNPYLEGDYVDLVSDQSITGTKTFVQAEVTQLNGSQASYADITTNNLVVTQGAMFNNNLTCNGSMYGLAMSACWADLAEYYDSDEQYPSGTLIRFGGEFDITVASQKYGVNGVVTEKPGFVLNSKDSGQTRTAIALVGKTPIRIIGKVRKFDRITMSDIDGVGQVKTEEGQSTVGIALASSEEQGEKLVMCVTKFQL